MHDDLHHAPERVAIALGCLDLGNHRIPRRLVKRADGAVVDAGLIGEGRRRAVVDLRGTDRDHVRHHLDTEGLAQEGAGDRSGRDPRSGFPGAGAFEHRAGVVESIFEHAGVIGMPGSRPGQWGVAGPAFGLQLGGIDGVGGHHRLPLRPFGVPDLNSDRPAQSGAMAHACQHDDFVLLELHPGAAAVTQTAAGELAGYFRGRDLHTGDHPLDHRHQGAAVGFTGSCPSQHRTIFPRWRPGTQYAEALEHRQADGGQARHAHRRPVRHQCSPPAHRGDRPRNRGEQWRAKRADQPHR